jgi:hypothetical protein
LIGWKAVCSDDKLAVTIGALDMSTTDEAQGAQQHRIGPNLGTAAAVVVLCIIGIAVVQLIRRSVNSFARGHTDEP